MLWLDPASLGVQDNTGQDASYDLGNDNLANNSEDWFFDVVGNIEVLVITADTASAGSHGYTLTVKDVPPLARGGAVVLDAQGDRSQGLTNALRRHHELHVQSLDHELLPRIRSTGHDCRESARAAGQRMDSPPDGRLCRAWTAYHPRTNLPRRWGSRWSRPTP